MCVGARLHVRLHERHQRVCNIVLQPILHRACSAQQQVTFNVERYSSKRPCITRALGTAENNARLQAARGTHLHDRPLLHLPPPTALQVMHLFQRMSILGHERQRARVPCSGESTLYANTSVLSPIDEKSFKWPMVACSNASCSLPIECGASSGNMMVSAPLVNTM